MPREIVKFEPYDSAEDLFMALGPHNPRWAAVPPRSWAFRGQGSTLWPLVPKMLREKLDESGLVAADYLTEGELGVLQKARQEGDRVTSTRILNIADSVALHQFLVAVDAAGIALPHDSPLLRYDIPKLPRTGHFPAPHHIAPLALAQHNGIPTRLLDWSWDRFTALYFGARTAAENLIREQPDDRFLVAALLVGVVRNLGQNEFEISPPPRLAFLSAPPSTNDDLKAQRGCFSLDRNAWAEESLDTSLADALSNTEEQERYGQAVEELSVARDVLVRMSLPCKEAPKVLRLLASQGVDASSAWPSCTGVVDAIQERQLWDKPPRPRSMLHL